MTTKSTPRQQLLKTSLLSDIAKDLEQSIQTYRNELTQGGLTLKAEQSLRWLIALHHLELLILRFTSGEPVHTLRTSLPYVIEEFEAFVLAESKYHASLKASSKTRALAITQFEAYVTILWLLALCKLTCHESLISPIIGWLNVDTALNRGTDVLLENIIMKLSGDCIPANNTIVHAKPYLSIGCATVYPAEKRAGFIKQFLDEWYKGMKPCYWHGMHTEKQGDSYFGYWAFEAALVTVLWEIDDTAYRDHAYYPRDLVDWARQNSAIEPIKDGHT